MSRDYTNRVWQDKKLKGGKLLVMLALAEHATPTGDSWPGMPLLIEKTRLTDRQIRRVLNALDADGTITIQERAIGRGKRPHYKLFPCEKADILSEQKADILSDYSEIKADISDNKSGHLLHEKADISDTDYSHGRSEPTTEPTTEPKGESTPPAAITPRVVSSGVKGAKAIPIDSPHLKDSKFVNGYIPPGMGQNAVEVYYERFSINADKWRLTDPQEDDLVRRCKDLELLREVVTTYDQANYEKPRNLKLIMDWYREPSRFRGSQNGTHRGRAEESSKPEYDPGYDPEIQRQFDEHVAKRKAEGSLYHQ